MARTVRPMNIEDIARECGVSISTVSRALNHEPGISPDTRRTVLRVARQHSFTLKQRKRPLRRSNLNLLVVVPEEEELSVNPFFNVTELLGAINEAFADEKKHVGIVTPEGFPGHLESGHQPPDGVIIAYRSIGAETKKRLAEIGIPYIFLSRSEPGDNHVSCNGFKGTLRLAEMLAAAGHRRIGYLGVSTNPNNTDRFRGYITALGEAGIPGGEKLSLLADTIHGVKAETASFFIKKGCDAVMCFNDYLAIRLIGELVAAGRSVPEDVSVTGFDDSPLGRVFSPSITTVRQPAFEMAFLAARWIRDNILRRRHQDLCIEVDGAVLVRQSARLGQV
ncbi:MAG: LacI family DNA-binding transcriptional regulator [Spirochaetes bacterium]|nr:LacI family DNA-binding transcriptional regulator [Spirochaetota bacterium]